MAQKRRNWTREELIVAFNLYCKIQFGKIHYTNSQVIELAQAIGRTPSAVSWKLVNFASLDSSHTDRGVVGAKNASKMDKLIFEEFTNNWEDLAYESEILLSKYLKKDVETKEDILIEGKEKERLVKTRVNQNFFRATVLSSYDSKCCLTGINIPSLLVASHIIPWSVDKINRMNPENGLCLNNLHDKAFDKGLITFDEKYKLVLSKELESNKDLSIQYYFNNIKGHKLNLPKRFLPNKSFLEYHNNNIFIS